MSTELNKVDSQTAVAEAKARKEAEAIAKAEEEARKKRAAALAEAEAAAEAAAAIDAACEIRAGLERLRTELSAEQAPAMRMRIGIHSGDVLVGSMGSAERIEWPKTARGASVSPL